MALPAWQDPNQRRPSKWKEKMAAYNKIFKPYFVSVCMIVELAEVWVEMQEKTAPLSLTENILSKKKY